MLCMPATCTSVQLHVGHPTRCTVSGMHISLIVSMPMLHSLPAQNACKEAAISAVIGAAYTNCPVDVYHDFLAVVYM